MLDAETSSLPALKVESKLESVCTLRYVLCSDITFHQYVIISKSSQYVYISKKKVSSALKNDNEQQRPHFGYKLKRTLTRGDHLYPEITPAVGHADRFHT